MWLEVGRTNNHPGVIANYFLNCVQQVGGTARVIRGDMGTENCRIAAIQRYLRIDFEDSWAGEEFSLWKVSFKPENRSLVGAAQKRLF